MAEILITHCNHLFFDRKQVRKMQPYPPLQALLAASSLRQAGFDVALFDATLVPPEEGFAEALAVHRPRLVFLCEDNFNFLTKMCLVRNREVAFFMGALAREEGVPVVAAGSDASDRVADYLRHGADFVVQGEVEVTICELSRRLLGGSRSAEGIPGVAWRDPVSGSLRLNPPRALLSDLDVLPMAAWDLVDIPSYRSAWLDAHGYFSLNMVSSRGCPYRCNWCAKPIYGNSYHMRSPRLVAAELAYLKQSFAPGHVWFADDIFALRSHWTSEFAEAVEALDAGIPFKMQSRADLMTRPAVAWLRRAGCAEVWMGAESGSQKVLDAMDKGIRVEHTYRACENLRAHGIRACFFLQFGYPGETWDDIQATMRMVRDLRPDDVGVSVAYPLPGTRFYDLVSPQLGAKKNWDDSDDLVMMFHGAYSSEFYRALRDAVHLEVAGKDAAAAWQHVEALEKTSATPHPTSLWTCC
jgi:radical SAM superfamily enzyme YgiQ (UPF0313 family)